MAQGYQPSLTKAFGNTNIHGVYINDEKRFNGPVKDGAELNEAVNQICGMINGNRIAQNNSISAKPYRRNYSEAFYSDYLPDIWIDHPDTIFPEKAESFISTNENYGPIESLESVPSDVNSGQKGARPLFITDLSTFNSLDENNDLDLTIVYEIVSSEFS